LGAELGGKMEEKAAEQLSSMVEVAVVVLLLVALFLILCWIICRVVRGVRVCCCAVTHPGDAVTEFFKRSGRYRTSGQVKFDFVGINHLNKILLSGLEMIYGRNFRSTTH
jgi:hypothetical protein